MKTGASRGIATILVTIVCVGFVSGARAEHRTNFLDALYGEVTNRVANPDTNNAAQRALKAASKILGRNTKTFAADLSALAAAAAVLNKRFSDEPAITTREVDALAAYENEAFVELDGAKIRLEGFSNDVPRLVIRQFTQATNAFNKYLADTNGFPHRARALARVFNKARMPVMKIFKQHPDPAGQSPDTIATSLNLDFHPAPNPSAENTYYCDTTSDNGATRSLTYFVNSPVHEEGTWEYFKTGPNTATVRVTPTAPQGLGQHDFLLIFTTTRVGTFTGSNSQGEAIHGDFLVD
jgi:hypothetical protein